MTVDLVDLTDTKMSASVNPGVTACAPLIVSLQQSVKELTAENKRLRGALGDIVATGKGWCERCKDSHYTKTARIAAKALGEL